MTVHPPGFHHAVLGVGPDASSEEIKQAYRILALALHPDKNPRDIEGATAMFQAVNAAFMALTFKPDAPGRCPYSRGPDSGGSGVDMRALPMSLRIGPARHNYVYTFLARDFYKCCRGSDWAQAGEVLFLLQDKGYWVALDAPSGATTAQDALAHGHAVFRSPAGILTPGAHTWESNYSLRGGLDWRSTGLCCETTVLGV